MKKYHYYVRYSCEQGDGQGEVVLSKEISSLNDIEEISSHLKSRLGVVIPEEDAVLIDFYSLLRVEDEDSEQ